MRVLLVLVVEDYFHIHSLLSSLIHLATSETSSWLWFKVYNAHIDRTALFQGLIWELVPHRVFNKPLNICGNSSDSRLWNLKKKQANLGDITSSLYFLCFEKNYWTEAVFCWCHNSGKGTSWVCGGSHRRK